MTRIPGIFAVLLAASMLSVGCAFGTRHVTLRQRPAAEPGLPVKPWRQIAVIVGDRRIDTSRIGDVRNGFYMHTADVVADNNVRSWIEEGIDSALVRLGYDVRSGNDSSTSDTPVLNASIEKVYASAYFVYDAEVGFTVRLTMADSVMLEKSYVGSGSAGLNISASADSYGESLSLAMAEAVALLSADIVRLLR